MTNMKSCHVSISGFSLYTLSFCPAVASLAACGTVPPPIGAPGAMRQPSAIATNTARGKSWMLPEAKSHDLLYISDPGSSSIDVFTYPALNLVGTIGIEDPEGLCVDKTGDVFATSNEGSDILEYAHGGTSPIANLIDENESPRGCAISPRTGDLAVTSLDTYYSTVVVYRKARGSPQAYSIPSMGASFCGYDTDGNLFVDGGHNGQSLLAELPFRSETFKMIQLERAIGAFGGVQWDGRHLAVGTFVSVYQIDVSGSSGRVVGVTPLSGSKGIFQFWIQGMTLIGPDLYADDVGFWNYPLGGESTKTIPYLFSTPFGSTVSLARK
jgi:hypothetical protein